MVLQNRCKTSHDAENNSISPRVRRETDPWLALIRDSKQRDQLFLLEEGEKLNQVFLTPWKTLFKSLAKISRIMAMEQPLMESTSQGKPEVVKGGKVIWKKKFFS